MAEVLWRNDDVVDATPDRRWRTRGIIASELSHEGSAMTDNNKPDGKPFVLEICPDCKSQVNMIFHCCPFPKPRADTNPDDDPQPIEAWDGPAEERQLKSLARQANTLRYQRQADAEAARLNPGAAATMKFKCGGDCFEIEGPAAEVYEFVRQHRNKLHSEKIEAMPR